MSGAALLWEAPELLFSVDFKRSSAKAKKTIVPSQMKIFGRLEGGSEKSGVKAECSGFGISSSGMVIRSSILEVDEAATELGTSDD